MTEEQPKSEQGHGYEPPRAEDLDTSSGPAATAAGLIDGSPPEDRE
jgi:hypothetical protein